MANAFKCDVVDCNEMAEGRSPSNFVLEAPYDVQKHLCQKHTDEIIEAYFPYLIHVANESEEQVEEAA